MKAQTLTPFELFGNQVRYVVPMFQRPYVWNMEDQWEPLWEDVRTVAERLLERVSAPMALSPQAMPPHFLGAIVLDQQLVPAAYIQTRHVIDGQQRLTTLQLLLDAAEWAIQNEGASADASALQTLILNNQSIAHSPDEVFKLWPTNYDRGAFRSVMRDDLEPSESERESKIAQAHAFFVKQISEWAAEAPTSEEKAARLHALALALTQHLKLVVIDLEPGDNAQVIFETLNHRGTPLLAGDLVKNFVFQASETQGADVDALYESSWKRFDADAWRREVKQGRLKRPRIDVFLNYWLTMRKVREVPADRIFSDFRNYVQESGQKVDAIVADLKASADAFDRLDHYPWTSAEGGFAYRILRVMEQFVFGPFLLWLFSWKHSELPVAQRTKALGAIESWSVRRMLCRMTTKQINQLVVGLLSTLQRKDPAFAGDVVVKFFSEQTADSAAWPTDQQVKEACLTIPLYTAITRARLRMVLEALEDQARTLKTEQQFCPRATLTVEHIMPQGWREHWKLNGDGHPEVMAARRDRLVHTLGNLTLVNDRLNPALSNRPWTDEEARQRGFPEQGGKRSILNQHSVLMLNKAIIDGWPDKWDEEQVEKRGSQLVDTLVKVWPRLEA